MERVEAGHLRCAGEAPAECFDQRDLSREMGDIEALRFTQSHDQLGSDHLVLRKANAAMHDAVADRVNLLYAVLL